MKYSPLNRQNLILVGSIVLFLLLPQNIPAQFLKTAQIQSHIILEAENATIVSGLVDNKYEGYSGTGFVDTENRVGVYIEFAVSIKSAGSDSLFVFFAHGKTDDRAALVSVNGNISEDTLKFNPTGSFTTWESESIIVPLSEGVNKIRIEALHDGGLPNIDRIEIAAEEGNPFFSLNLNVKGSGKIEAEPDNEYYFLNTDVKLSAVPLRQGVVFKEWQGDASGDNNPLIVSLDSDKNITAVFVDTSFKYEYKIEELPVGFASAAGNGMSATTGGLGGDTVICAKGQSLSGFLTSSHPRVIVIEDTVVTTEIKGYSNLTILGKGKNAAMKGLALTNSSNIIIRNITFYDSPDGLRITTTSSNLTHHVWVDHCTFTDSPAIDTDGKTHDGLLDITHRSSYITVSWCLFENHRKACLLGYSASGSSGETEPNQLMVTYHHNWFNATNSRHPRARWAPVHVFNNLFNDNSYGVGSTCGAQVLVESNYFENSLRPVLISQVNDPGETLSGDPVGYVKAVGNVLVNSENIVENLSGFNFDPKNYYSYEADSALYISEIVKTWAGAGKVEFISGTPTSIYPGDEDLVPQEFMLYQNYPNPFNPETTIKISLQTSTQHVNLKIFDLLGREVQTVFSGELRAGIHEFKVNCSSLSSGVYFYSLQSGYLRTVKQMLLIK